MISNKDKLRFEELDKIAYELFKEGKSLVYISNHLGIKRQSLTRRLKEKYNITYNLNGKKEVDSFFFSEATEKSMYWLGFIFADGNLSSERFYLELTIKDKEHLLKFKEDIKSSHKVSEKVVKGTSYWRITLRNNQIYMDLLRWGVTPRKSFKDNEFPSIPNEYELAFLRGFIDGDGSYNIRKRKSSTYPLIEITVGFHSKGFAYELQKKFNQYGIGFKIYTGKTSYRLMNNRREEAISFLNMLYKNSTIHLDRKYDKIKSFCRFQ